jgi:hypothetical protein
MYKYIYIGHATQPEDQLSPSVINWMAVADYFSCRNAHNIPLDANVLTPSYMYIYTFF